MDSRWRPSRARGRRAIGIGTLFVVALCLATSCKDSQSAPPAQAFVPGEPALLSVGSPTKDEDPSVLLARDGTIFVAWFSDRGNNPDSRQSSENTRKPGIT